MAEPGSQSTMPPILLVIMTVLGFTTIQGTMAHRSNRGSSEVAGTEQGKYSLSETPASSDQEDERSEQVLQPLYDHFVQSDLPDHSPGAVYKQLRSGHAEAGIRCLIVTVPDPIASTNSHRFDEHLDAVQRAVEAHGYVLDGYRIPWDRSEKPSAQKPDRFKVQIGPGDSSVEFERVKASASTERQPGVVLFRRTAQSDDLLLVLLVPETPTFGLDKQVLIQCLDRAKEWDVRNQRFAWVRRLDGAVSQRRSGVRALASVAAMVNSNARFLEMLTTEEFAATAVNYTLGRPHINILGPYFSGSIPSLAQTLGTWLKAEKIPTEVVLLSGTASNIDASGFASDVALLSGQSQHTLSLQATRYQTKTILRALLHYVGQEEPIAILTESDTALGHYENPNDEPGQDRRNLFHYAFPSNISQLRTDYDHDGALEGHTHQVIPSAERLTVPLADSGPPRDIIAPKTPGFTSAAAELVLNEMMTDLARRRFKKVGIIATDPRDVLFLAKKVKQACQDVQLFTPGNNRLFSHPDFVSFMRGMLVGSTYPLFPRNQELSFPYIDGEPHLFFASDNAEGAYNATVAQMLKLGALTGNPIPPQFLEYGVPYDDPFKNCDVPDRVNEHDVFRRQPPIWIGTIGYHGVFPISAMSLEDAEQVMPKTAELATQRGLLYAFDQTFADFRSREPGTVNPDEVVQAKIERVRHRLCPRITLDSLFSFWGILFSVSTVACLTLAGVTWSATRWIATKSPTDSPETFKLGPLASGGLAIFLNCCYSQHSVNRPCYGVGRTKSGPSFQGPGLALPSLHILATVCYGASVRPLLCGVLGAWENGFAPEPWAVGFASLAAMTCVVMIVVAFPHILEFAARILRSAVCSAIVAVMLIAAVAASLSKGWALTAALWTLGLGCAVTCSRLRPDGPKRLRFLFGLLAITAVCAAAVIGTRFAAGSASLGSRTLYSERNSLLALERSMIVTSGVDPVFSLVCLSVAGGALLVMRLTDRHFFQQLLTYLPPQPDVPEKQTPDGAVGIEQMRSRMKRAYRDLQDNMESPLGFVPWFATRHILKFGLLLCLLGYFIGSLPLFASATHRFDGSFFGWISLVLFGTILAFLTLNSVRLALMWKSIHETTRGFLQWPVSKALDRLPPRVARWFFESPSLDDSRLSLIVRAANVLSEQLRKGENDSAMSIQLNELLKKDPERRQGDSHASDWKGISTVVAELGKLKPFTASQCRADVWPIVRAHWETESVADAYRSERGSTDGHGGRPAKPDRAVVPAQDAVNGTANGSAPALYRSDQSATAAIAVWSQRAPGRSTLRRIKTRFRAADTNGSQAIADPTNPLTDLIEAAEDFFILAFVSWLAVEMAHVWKRITLLVVTALALLLALSSYPFAFQSHLMFGLWLVIGFLTVLIVRIVLWINTEELLARLANQSPNKWFISGGNLSMLLTHVVPLLGGILAATSSSVSDMLGTFLDPILRYLH